MANKQHMISLDGDWKFAYTPYGPDHIGITMPLPKAYEVTMPVPGYWDDNTDRLQYASFWSRDCRFNPDFRHITFPMGAGKPADASLPYIVGAGWYKKQFMADTEWKEGTVTLCVGGVTLEAWVYLNNQFIVHHIGHLTPFEIRIEEWLKPGEINELTIVVVNTRTDRTGCSIRGFKGKSAGIYRSIDLKIAGHTRIKDSYLHTDKTMNQLAWEIELDGKPTNNNLELDWEIQDPHTGKRLASGTQSAELGKMKWMSDTFGMKAWSDRQPNLYKVMLQLRDGEQVIDNLEQMFGLRHMEVNGIKMQLNGSPIMLRGLTDHAYFPETCTPPSDIEFYRTTLKKVKQLGFNWVRYHTWTPPVECLQAADELGMLLQVEAPNGFTEKDWLDILHTCRKHPSVVVYCCGNEVALDEKMLANLKRMGQHLRKLVPDALYNPMEGLRAIEYEIKETDDGYVTEPYPHNAKRLAEIKSFADVFSPHGSIFSYHSLDTTDEMMDERFQILERPSLVHEAGINDSYLNLDLEHRYVGTRIGTELYAAARSHLKQMGVLENAPVYYHNSCRWMHQVVKYSMENARRCEYVSGYDLLGAIDCHWHRTGYAVGLLNEFYELKSGITPEKVLNYNGESVLLANCGKLRNLVCGQDLNLTISASLYGQNALEFGHLSWALVDEERQVFISGGQTVAYAATGKVEVLGDIKITAPDTIFPKKLLLKVNLSGSGYQVTNEWEYWVFPEVNVQKSVEALDQAETRVLKALDEEGLSFVASGGKVLLLGSLPFPSLPTTFQIMSGGRVHGNNATVVRNHPLMVNFPHEGFCDWQFYSMLNGARTVVFNDLKIPFNPIVEVVSSYKMIRKQASLFELQVGKGRLLVCTLRMDESDCGAQYLYNRMLNYMASSEFVPEVSISSESLAGIINEAQMLNVDFSTDEAYDNGGHVQNVD